MVRIHRKLDSETLHIPELKPMIGKNVEITVREETTADGESATGNWDTALKAVGEVEDYDFEARRRQREI